MKSATLNPGPLAVGHRGINTDGGIVIRGSTSQITSFGDNPATSASTFGAGVMAISSTTPGYSVSWGTASNTFFVMAGTDNIAHAYFGTWTFESSLSGLNFHEPPVMTSYMRSVGVAHASHTACTSGIYGALEFCTTHGAFETCTATGGWRRLDHNPPTLVGSTISDGLPWSGTNVRAVVTMPRDWTATHISSVFAAGTGTGTAAFTCFSLAEWGGDGGTCSFGGLKCSGTGGCPDAGEVCAVPASGQCDFAANANVFCTGSGAAGCVTDQPSSLGIGIYGTTGSANN